MYLLLWGSFLTLCSTLISPLVDILVHISCSITDYEIQLSRDIRQLRKELKEISMMDEFATYAKTERKINKMKEKLSQCASGRTVQRTKARWAFKICFNCILGMMVLATMWSWSGSPVATLPPHWVTPLGWPLSLPTGVAGGVSLPVWMAISRTVLQVVPSIPTPSFAKREYSQLPLD
jgi:hypothetical protein